MYRKKDYIYYNSKEKNKDDTVLVFIGFFLLGLIMFAVLL